MAKSFRDLEVWQLGMDLTTQVYRLTATFPDHERYGLTNQIRRSAVSVPANIAEGHGRHTVPAFVSFLRIAMGSLNEMATLTEIATSLGYLTAEPAEGIQRDIRRLSIKVQNLITSLTKSTADSDSGTT